MLSGRVEEGLRFEGGEGHECSGNGNRGHTFHQSPPNVIWSVKLSYIMFCLFSPLMETSVWEEWPPSLQVIQ